MTVHHYYNLCQKHQGRAVEVRTHNGSVHRGVIHRVDRQKVYIQPLQGNRNLGGFGYGYYGGYRPWGFGFGFATGIALGAIATLAFIPFFFW